MNQINSEVFNAGLQRVLNEIKKQKSNSVEIKKLLATETLKLLKKTLGENNFVGDIYQGGLNKQELLNSLEEIFDQKNFLNGKYKGGKDLII